MEAQEDGVMGKIIVQAGAQKIPVGQVIAVLAEEGDDLSSITIPETPAASASASEQPKQEAKEEAKSAEQKSAEQKAREQPRDERTHREHKEIKHPKPLFPSVSRLYVSPRCRLCPLLTKCFEMFYSFT